MNGKMSTIETKLSDERFEEATMLISKCKKIFDEEKKKLESIRGHYLKAAENLVIFKVANKAYDLLDDVRETKKYN